MDLIDSIYHDEDTARAHLELLRWPDGIVCPHCDGTEKCKPTPMYKKATKKNPEKLEVKGYYHCGACLQKFTVRTGTQMHCSHIPLHKWVAATYLICSYKDDITPAKLSRILGITYKTTWFLYPHIVRFDTSRPASKRFQYLISIDHGVRRDRAIMTVERRHMRSRALVFWKGKDKGVDYRRRDGLVCF